MIGIIYLQLAKRSNKKGNILLFISSFQSFFIVTIKDEPFQICLSFSLRHYLLAYAASIRSLHTLL